MTNLAVGGTTALPYTGPVGSVLSITIDCSETPLAAGVHEAMNIPAGTWVAKVSYRVTTADTGASTRTFSLGDGADDDGYAVAVDAKTLATGSAAPALTEAAPNTVTGYTLGKFYAAADTIDIKALQDLTDAVIEVRALVFGL